MLGYMSTVWLSTVSLFLPNLPEFFWHTHTYTHTHTNTHTHWFFLTFDVFEYSKYLLGQSSSPCHSWEYLNVPQPPSPLVSSCVCVCVCLHVCLYVCVCLSNVRYSVVSICPKLYIDKDICCGDRFILPASLNKNNIRCSLFVSFCCKSER